MIKYTVHTGWCLLLVLKTLLFLKGKLKATAVVALSEEISYEDEVEALDYPAVLWKCEWGDHILLRARLWIQNVQAPSTYLSDKLLPFLGLVFPHCWILSKVLSICFELHIWYLCCIIYTSTTLSCLIIQCGQSGGLNYSPPLLTMPIYEKLCCTSQPGIQMLRSGWMSEVSLFEEKIYQVLPVRIILILSDGETRVAACYNHILQANSFVTLC